MSEIIPLTDTITIERSLPAGVTINASSDIPAEGPQTAMLMLSVHDIAAPNKKFGGTGVEVEMAAPSNGTYMIIVTPSALPFAGTLKIG